MIEGPADFKVVAKHADKSRIREHFADDPVRTRQSSLATLGGSLCEFKHQLSKHSTDLGHVIVDPFRIVLKQDAIPVKQKPYRHSSILAAKVRTEIYKFLLASISHRSYSNWASPLVVAAKSDGCVRLTCNYIKVYGRNCNNSNLSASSGLRSSLRTRNLKIFQQDRLDE